MKIDEEIIRRCLDVFISFHYSDKFKDKMLENMKYSQKMHDNYNKKEFKHESKNK